MVASASCFVRIDRLIANAETRCTEQAERILWMEREGRDALMAEALLVVLQRHAADLRAHRRQVQLRNGEPERDGTASQLRG